MPEPVRVFVSHHRSAEEDAITARLVADLEAADADVGLICRRYPTGTLSGISIKGWPTVIGSSSS
jgi:hypothetical protein